MLQYHKLLLEDKVRLEKFEEAMACVVKSGDVVVDIGAGSGILSFLACKAGAKNVIAIETRPEIIELAKAVAIENGFLDKITFINKLSFNTELPEKADLIISEMLGPFGFDEGIASIFSDAKKRFLKPEGKIMPAHLTIVLEPIYASHFYDEVAFWDRTIKDINFKSAHKLAINQVYNMDADKSLSAEATTVFKYDFYQNANDNIGFSHTFAAKKNSEIFGFLGWFEAELADNVILSNKPGVQTHWNQSFFPIEMPVMLKENEHIRLRVDGFSLKGRFYWSWKTEILNPDKSIKNSFSQNNLDVEQAARFAK